MVTRGVVVFQLAVVWCVLEILLKGKARGWTVDLPLAGLA